MVSLDAEGDCLPQNEGAPDGLPFFFFLVSFLSTALSWQSHGFCECLMKSSFLILVVVFFFFCVHVHACVHTRAPFLLPARQSSSARNQTEPSVFQMAVTLLL